MYLINIQNLKTNLLVSDPKMKKCLTFHESYSSRFSRALSYRAPGKRGKLKIVHIKVTFFIQMSSECQKSQLYCQFQPFVKGTIHVSVQVRNGHPTPWLVFSLLALVLECFKVSQISDHPNWQGKILMISNVKSKFQNS